jgi:hypothetical protein
VLKVGYKPRAGEIAHRFATDYKFEDTRAFLPLYVYDLERYDIGKIFSINSHDQVFACLLVVLRQSLCSLAARFRM